MDRINLNIQHTIWGVLKFPKHAVPDEIHLNTIKSQNPNLQRKILHDYFRRSPKNIVNVKAWNSLGNANTKLGRYDEAEECFNNILIMQPDDIKALNGIGKIKYLRGDTVTAIKIFSSHMNDLYSLSWLRKIYLDMGNKVKARETLEAIHALKNANTASLREAGELALENEDAKFAIVCYERMLELKPQDLFTVQMLGFAAMCDNDPAYAVKCFEYVNKNKPGDIETLRHLGNAYLGLDLFNRAKQCFRTILEINESDQAAVEMLENIRELTEHKI